MLPVRKPLPSGLYGTKPMPSSDSVGSISGLRFSPPQRVLALQGRHGLHGVSAANGLRRRLRQPEMFHFAALDQFLDRSGHVLDGDLGVDAVLVEQIDGLHAQPAQRIVGDLLDVVGPDCPIPRCCRRRQAEPNSSRSPPVRRTALTLHRPVPRCYRRLPRSKPPRSTAARITAIISAVIDGRSRGSCPQPSPIAETSRVSPRMRLSTVCSCRGHDTGRSTKVANRARWR